MPQAGINNVDWLLLGLLEEKGGGMGVVDESLTESRRRSRCSMVLARASLSVDTVMGTCLEMVRVAFSPTFIWVTPSSQPVDMDG